MDILCLLLIFSAYTSFLYNFRLLAKGEKKAKKKNRKNGCTSKKIQLSCRTKTLPNIIIIITIFVELFALT